MSNMIKTIGGKKLLADYNTEGKKLALKEEALTAGSNITIDGNVVSSDQLFVATYGTTTFAEVKAAFDAGKICMCKQSNNSFSLLYAVTDSNIRFVYTNPVSRDTQSWNVNTNNTWLIDSIAIQPKLTFDTAPTLDSNNPVTSSGIRTLSPLATRVDDITEDKLIFKSSNFIQGSSYADASYVFGLQYGNLLKLMFRSNVNSTTSALTLYLLNAAYASSDSVKALRASVCKNADETYCFVIWLDHTAEMRSRTYFYEYFPDMTNTYSAAGHLAPFDKTSFSEVRDLTLSYQPVGLPVLPTSGTSALKCVNGVLQWIEE